MNRVHSINNPEIVNGTDMKNGDFGVVREVRNAPTSIRPNQSVFKSDNRLICLENGVYSAEITRYEVEIKDTLTLQRIK